MLARHDLLLQRRPVIRVVDPVVRLHHLVIEPHLADLESGRSDQPWAEAAHTVESKILGPHLEVLATEWVAHDARRLVGLDIGATGQADVSCREHATHHDVDVLALRRGERPRTSNVSIALIGEAKARDRRPGLTQLYRLEHIRQLLTAAGHDADDATLALFSAGGFTDELREAAQNDDKVLLIGLDTLYAE